MSPEKLRLFAQSLAPTDRVVLEATGNASAIAGILEPHVSEVVLAHAKQVRAISHARIKTGPTDRALPDPLLPGGGVTPACGPQRACVIAAGESATCASPVSAGTAPEGDSGMLASCGSFGQDR